jgi:hypothetical protein
MPRGRPSGISLNLSDACIVLGMVKRGDRAHDIAAWFGVNQGRIAEAQDGIHHPTATAASLDKLPPSGPPGVKGRRLHAVVTKALLILDGNSEDAPAKALKLLREGKQAYDKNET